MIKDNIILKEKLEEINYLLKECKDLLGLSKERKYKSFQNVANGILGKLNEMNKFLLKLKEEEGALQINLACESIISSLNNILLLSRSRSNRITEKIEFELIPLLQEMQQNFYFQTIVLQNENLIDEYYKNEVKKLSANKYIDEAISNDKYKYDLSICILAYNNIEYTKLCVESVLKYTPQDVNYELILINHGSTDGTKEYFESISPTKQIDILKNGGGLFAAYRIIEGKYVLGICNDVIVTENAISNMIACMESDEKIARIVPSTSSVSNLQTIPVKYGTLDELEEFAKKNNVKDKFKWEQRSRLCDPISMVRSSVVYSSIGIPAGRYYITNNIQAFPDDSLSLLLRREGYKMILAKDAYCHHFGSVTLNNEINQYEDGKGSKGQFAFYNEGRKAFYQLFGIDPWCVGFCWEPYLILNLPCNEKEHVDILGINCGMGSNPLKIKESIKENVHNLDVTTYNVTDDICYIEDLKGVSDFAEYIDNCSKVEDIFKDKKFKYVIMESKFETYGDSINLVDKLKERVCEDGILAIKIIDENKRKEVKDKYVNGIEANQWIILK